MSHTPYPLIHTRKKTEPSQPQWTMVPSVHPLEEATPLTWLVLSPVGNNTHQVWIHLHRDTFLVPIATIPLAPFFLSCNFDRLSTQYLSTLFCCAALLFKIVSMCKFHFSDKLSSLWLIAIVGAQPFLSCSRRNLNKWHHKESFQFAFFINKKKITANLRTL